MINANWEIITLQNQNHTKSFSSYGFRCPKELNPFLNLDFFHMSMPTFPPHPHAGFSAITYLFKDSDGNFQNRDSYGDQSKIKAGGLHWSQAARGMMQEEIPLIPGLDCYGLQMFVKLPEEYEVEDGRAFHLKPEEIPKYNEVGLIVNILAGSYKGVNSNLPEIKPRVDFFDIELEKNVRMPLTASNDEVILIICLKGQLELEGKIQIDGFQVACLKNQTRDFEVVGMHEKNQILFLSAKYLPEEYFWNGPFCMSSTERLLQAKIQYQKGLMGALKPSF